MKDRILSHNELDTLSRNIRAIDNRLGHPAPRNLLNADDLSKKILSHNELDTLTRNIRLVEYKASEGNSALDCWPIYLGVAIIVYCLLCELKMAIFGI